MFAHACTARASHVRMMSRKLLCAHTLHHARVRARRIVWLFAFLLTLSSQVVSIQLTQTFPPYIPLLLLSARGQLTDHYCSKHMTPFWNDRICLLLSLKKSSDAIHNDNNTMFVIFTSTPHDICIKLAIICSRLGELSNKWRVICMKLVDISNRNSLGIWINDSQEGCVCWVGEWHKNDTMI